MSAPVGLGGAGSPEGSPEPAAQIREALEAATMVMPPCTCQEMDGAYKMCESCAVGDKLSAALRLLEAAPASVSGANRPNPSPEVLDGGAGRPMRLEADVIQDPLGLSFWEPQGKRTHIFLGVLRHKENMTKERAEEIAYRINSFEVSPNGKGV